MKRRAPTSSSVGGTGTSAKTKFVGVARVGAVRCGSGRRIDRGEGGWALTAHRAIEASRSCVYYRKHTRRRTDGAPSFHRTPQNSQQGQQARSVPSAGAHSNAPIMVSSLPRDDGPDIKAINDTGTCFFSTPKETSPPCVASCDPERTPQLSHNKFCGH